MKVILISDVKGLGKANEVVEVKEGYGRNFLIKNKLAREASAEGLNDVKLKAGAKALHEKRALEAAMDMKSKLGDKNFTMNARAGEGGKLFGAVTAQDISDILTKNGYEITKKQVVINTPIKSVGSFTVRIKLHPEVSCDVRIEVEGKSKD